MSEIALKELEHIGRQVAADVAGAENVEQMELQQAEDWTHKPMYHYVFLIDQNRDGLGLGELSTRIDIRIRDELVARGDYSLPFIRILRRRDWDKLKRAQPH